MSLSKPKSPVFVRDSVIAQAQNAGLLNSNENSTLINQLHGIAFNNSLGAGIPKQVTNVQASVANAQTGATCTVSVLFRVDATDKNFAGVNIWVKGYQGNNQLVQVASGTSSPTKFVLNNTGETISFTIQAYGNGGGAPLTASPSCSGNLPQSSGGGFGSSTTTSSPPTGLTMPAEFSVTGNGTASIIVSKVSEIKRTLWAAPVDANGAPTFRALNLLDLPSAIVLGKVRGVIYAPNTNSILNAGLGDQSISTLGTFTYTAPTATEGASGKLTAGAGAGNQATVYHANVRGVSIGSLKYYYCRAALGSTTLINWWAGITNVNPGTTLLQTSPTTQNLVMFAWIPSVIPTNFAIVACDGAGTPTIASSGIAADLNFHDFLIVFSAGSAAFYIDGVLVGTISTHLPSTSLDCDTIITSQNTGATASFWFFEHEWWSS